MLMNAVLQMIAVQMHRAQTQLETILVLATLVIQEMEGHALLVLWLQILDGPIGMVLMLSQILILLQMTPLIMPTTIMNGDR
jgi:hypothetical protein